MRVWLALVFAVALQGQDRPELRGISLGKVDVHSIHGRHLGPEVSCKSETPSAAPALCSVVVFLDEQLAPLIYTQAEQIKFVAPRRGKVTLRVVYRGLSSRPVSVQLERDRVVVEPVRAAYTRMPIWVRVKNASRPDRPIELPRGLTLQFAGCPRIEVQFHGALLPRRRTMRPLQRAASSGPPCKAPLPPQNPEFAGRAPLHLQYSFDRPGLYLVRYVSGDGGPLDTADSVWTPLQVKPSTPARRAKWLRDLAASAPTDRESLVYDFLPSIFGYGDAATLEVAKKYLQHPDAVVAATTAAYIRDYYPADVVRDLVR